MEDSTIFLPPPGEPAPIPPVAPAPEKYVLTKKSEIEEELKIFFMGVVQNPMIPQNANFRNRNVGIIAYNHPTALKKAVEVWANPTGAAINSNEEDFTPVKDILKVINIEGVTIQNVAPEPEKTKLMPLDTFKAALLMANEEYVKLGAHKIAIKRIIETL